MHQAHRASGATLIAQTHDAGAASVTAGAGIAQGLGRRYGRYFGESTATVQLVIEGAISEPAAVGVAVGNLGLLHQRMDAAIKGYPYAKAAIDIAAYDLAGRARGIPVHELLGGAVRDTIAVAHSIGLMAIEDGECEAGKVASEGIRTVKIKVGVEPARDVEMVRRIRAAVGPDVSLCVDANEGYKTPGEAIKTIRRMEALDLIMPSSRSPASPHGGVARVDRR